MERYLQLYSLFSQLDSPTGEFNADSVLGMILDWKKAQ